MTDRLENAAPPNAAVLTPESVLESVAPLPAAPGPPRVATPDEERLERLTRVCVDDVITAFGLGGVDRGRAVLELLSRVPVRRLARQVLTFETSGPRCNAAG